MLSDMAARGTKLRIGDEAPDFVLPAAGGDNFALRSLRGRKVVLFFYPMDESPGCTMQACGFRDHYDEFVASGAEVVGINSGRVASHERFADHHLLPYPVLSDPGNRVRSVYGAFKGPIPGRVTYLVDENGVVRDIFSSIFRPLEHIRRAREWIGSETTQDE
ncbi:MAG: peroxiredoxin [Gammaproteobacteria bacterium]|nr:peroxiredoxin [Gammaproteobacteria bacterium]